MGVVKRAPSMIPADPRDVPVDCSTDESATVSTPSVTVTSVPNAELNLVSPSATPHHPVYIQRTYRRFYKYRKWK